MTPAQLAATIDHTQLKPEATPDQIAALCDEGLKYSFAGICVNPCFVRQVADRVACLAGRPRIVSVSGFPLGANLTSTKEDEARRAIDDGADEIDMVINIGALVSGDRSFVRKEIEALARIVHGGSAKRRLKVILETRVLTEEQIVLGCRCCAEGEADFVKTSTGLHPSGGATAEHVRLLHRHSAPMGVKASGGIRTLEQARAMIGAGAARLGTSSSVAIMRELASLAR